MTGPTVLRFGVFFQGVNFSTVWTEAESGSQTDFESFRRVAQTAERGLFSAFFLGEGLRLREHLGALHQLDVAGRPDAQTQLAALAAVTERIGLVATQNTTYNDPLDLAHRLAALAGDQPAALQRLEDREVAVGEAPAVAGDAVGGEEVAVLVAFEDDAAALGEGVQGALLRFGDVQGIVSDRGVRRRALRRTRACDGP